jgi:hypothetical protein
MLAQGMRELSGDTDASGGRKPGQVSSGAGVELLQMAASTTLRLKARQVEYMIGKIGQKVLSRILQYYDDERVFNLIGDENHYKEYVFERARLKESLDNAKVPFQDAYQFFQFKVVPASSLSMTKWQKGLIATQLFQLGAIDREALLDTIEFPNREEILARTIDKQKSGEEPARASKGMKIPKNLMRAGATKQEGALQRS